MHLPKYYIIISYFLDLNIMNLHLLQIITDIQQFFYI